MSVNRLQGFPAGELSFAALVAQLPVAVGGQAGITIPVLYDNLLSDPGADMPFAGPEGAYYVQALSGAVASAAIGPGPNAPVHAVCFNRGSGPVVVAIACRDPLMGMLVGTGKALPGNAANQLGIASAAGAATAHALIQGCFARLTSFVQTAATTYAGRDLVLTGHGTGGYFALALRCLLPGQIARAYAFDAPAHGLRTAFPPAGGDVDDRVLEVRSISADSVHQMESALGRRLLVDAATFGYQVSGPLKEGPGRGTLLDRTLRRLAADPRPEPLLGPLLSITGGMPGQQPAASSHPCHDLLRLLGGHLAQVGQAGTVLRLTMHHDGSVRIDIPGTVAGQSASPARGLRFGSDGTMAVGSVPGGTLHVSSGLTWGDGVGTVLTILPWDGGNYASEVPIDPATGLIAGEAGTVSFTALLDSIFGSGAQVSLPPIVDAETQITQSWRQRDAWIDPALSIDQTPDLLPLLAGGLPSAAGTLMGMVSMGTARPDAAEAVHGVIRDVVQHVGGYLDALFGTMSGPYQHSKLLWSADLPSLSEVQRERRPGHVAGYIALHTVTFLLRGLTTPGAAILSPASLGTLVAGAAGRFLAGRLGVGPVVSDVAAWQQALTETKTAGADVSLSEVWRLPSPISIRPETLPVLLATTDLTARPTVGLLLLTALAEATGLSAPPSGAQATVIRAFNGQKQNLGVTASRSGYEGPLERLVIRAAAVADIPHALVNTITGGLGVRQNGVPPITLAHQPSSDLFALLGTTPDQTGLAPAVSMTRQVSFLLAATPGVPDPVIAALLQRDWVDWLLLAQEAVFRQSLPRQPELYSWFDTLIATQSGLGLMPALRPARGTDAVVMVGLLAELNRVATALVASGGNPAAMADAFLNLVDGLSPLAASMHIPAHTLPVLPPAPATILERLSFWLDEIAGLTEPVLRGAIDTSTAPLLPPTGIVITSVAPVQTDGTQVPGIEVKWNLVGPGQHILIRWRERDAADWQITSVTLAVSTYVIRPILAGKSYDIELARSNGARQSLWVAATSKGAKTGLENASVIGLHLTGLNNATEWVGRDVSISWRGAYPNAVIDPTTSMAITPIAYMDGYIVKVFDGASKQLLRQTQPSMQTDYIYSYESNDTDTARLLLSGPTRSLHFEVFIVPKSGQAIGKAELKVTNPAPAKVVVTARTGIGSLQVSVTPVSDRDLSRYVLWISDQPGFDPATTDLIDIGATTEYSRPLLKVGPCYVRAAAVDLFQPKNGLDLANLNISDEVVAELADITIDKVPPAVPSGLVLSSTATITDSGETQSILTATWDRNIEEDFLLYEVQMRQLTSEIWLTSLTGLPEQGRPAFNWSVLPNTDYFVRVRARDRSGNRSDYCAPVQQLSERDLAPPAAPTGFAVSAGARTIGLRWTNPDDADWFETEIWIAAVEQLPGNPPAAAPVMPPANSLATTVTTDSWVFAAPSRDTRYHFWIRATDTSGNHSPFAGPLSCTTPLITTADFTTGSIDARILSAGTVTAGLLEVASRAITVENLVFEPNCDSENSVSENWVCWKGVAGASPRVIYKAVNNAGVEVERNLLLTEGSAQWTGGILYLYIVDPLDNSAVNVQVADNYAAASGSRKLILGTYAGGTRLIVTHGATVITGDMIQTNAIKAGHIEAGAITASSVRIGGSNGGATLASLLADGMTTIDGGKISTGSIDASSLKVKSRIVSISDLDISFNDTKVQWTESVLNWTNDIGARNETILPAGQQEAPIGQRLRLYWEPGAAALTLTDNSSINPSATASILATIQRGALVDPIKMHHQDVVIKGNKVTAGAVDANIIRTDMLDAREVRMGVTVDGEAGIYMRTTDNGNVVRVDGTTEDGAREGQRTIFATSVYQDAQGRPNAVRRAQLFVSANGSDAGFEAWNSAGIKIFDSNGLRPGTVATRELRPESATFVRTCRGTWVVANPKIIRVVINIQGLKAGEWATIVLMAFSNGHISARDSDNRLDSPNPDSYRMWVMQENLNVTGDVITESPVGHVWLSGHFLMHFQDSVQVGNGRYAFYVTYTLVSHLPGNANLPASIEYIPFTSLTALVSMR